MMFKRMKNNTSRTSGIYFPLNRHSIKNVNNLNLNHIHFNLYEMMCIYIKFKFVQNIFLADSFRNESSDGPYERVTESLTHSIHSNTWIHSVTSQVTVLMNESLNHWLTWFVQTADSFSNESSDCPYERVTESFTHLIRSNGWFIQKRVKWLSLWTSHWIIDSIHSNGWFIQ